MPDWEVDKAFLTASGDPKQWYGLDAEEPGGEFFVLGAVRVATRTCQGGSSQQAQIAQALG